jgi:hypothetical protein
MHKVRPDAAEELMILTGVGAGGVREAHLVGEWPSSTELVDLGHRRSGAVGVIYCRTVR